MSTSLTSSFMACVPAAFSTVDWRVAPAQTFCCQPDIRYVRLGAGETPLAALAAFRDGADGVLLLPDVRRRNDLRLRRQFVVLQEMLGFVGYEPQRLRLAWCDAHDLADCWQITGEFCDTVHELGPWDAGAQDDSALSQDLPGLGLDAAGSEHAPERANTALRSLGCELLAAGRVDAVLGWQQDGDHVSPVLARTPAEVQRLFASGAGYPNLGAAMAGHAGLRVAALLNPAEARTVAALAEMGLLQRQNVLVLGTAGAPGDYDAMVNAPRLPETRLPGEALLTGMERWPARARAGFWRAQFGRCVGCAACSSACPLGAATAGAGKIQPGSVLPDVRAAIATHLTRLLLVSDRCVACNACAGSCPQSLPLALLHRKLALAA